MSNNSYFLLLFLTISTNCLAQEEKLRVEVIPPNAEQEAVSIWRTINDFTFLEEQGYSIQLPSNDLIDSLILKSKNGTFGNDDYPAVYDFVDSQVFKIEDYQKAITTIEEQIPLIHQFIQEIEQKRGKWDWTFKSFDSYRISLTLFGTGGSYDPNAGTITLFTTKDGGFMNYRNPANTIIHEIVHMGMEESLVQRFDLPHGLKERIVDTFVHLMFKEDLPEYRIQNMGDPEIDQFLQNQEDLANLSDILSNF